MHIVATTKLYHTHGCHSDNQTVLHPCISLQLSDRPTVMRILVIARLYPSRVDHCNRWDNGRTFHCNNKILYCHAWALQQPDCITTMQILATIGLTVFDKIKLCCDHPYNCNNKLYYSHAKHCNSWTVSISLQQPYCATAMQIIGNSQT